VFAALFIPNFAAQAVLRAEPALLREQPLAILEGTPPQLRVIAMNHPARTAGVELGMTRLQAEALPHLVTRRRSPPQEETAHAAALDCAAAFSPRVEAIAADTVVLDITGLERLFGAPATIAGELARRAGACGLETNVAVAGNIEAAVHAARGFTGITVIPRGEEAHRLSLLPIDILINSRVISAADEQRSKSRLHSPEELLEIFDRWGIRTFRAFALLPAIAVAERLGQHGVMLQKLARGEGIRQLAPATPPLRFEEALELEHPIENLESLAFALSGMLEQLCVRLESRALATNQMRLRLELEDIADRVISKKVLLESAELQSCEIAKLKFVNHEDQQFRTSAASQFRTLKLPVPMRDPRTLLKLWQLQFQAHPPQAPVMKISIAAQPAPPQNAQHGLFLPLEPQPERLELLLARIAAILGPGAGADDSELCAGSPVLLDSDRPDAFRMEGFNPQSTAKVRECKTAKLESNDCAPFPDRFRTLAFRVFRPPRAATVELRQGMPARVHCANAAGPRGDIVWLAGPWRSSGDWWNPRQAEGNSHEPPTWSREEWEVRIATHAQKIQSSNGVAGALYRLVRNAHTGAWSVDGMYD
jgi:protein ImuB